MGRFSRDKGARGERAVCAIDTEYGFETKRTASMQAGDSDNEYADVTCREWPLSILFREVKVYARTPVNRFVDEYVIPERAGYVPTLVYRDNGKPFIACLRYTDLVKLMAELRNARKELNALNEKLNPPFASEVA